MQFSDIPFKSKEKVFLLKQVEENRIPHAQIFLGREGSGALALAIAYASYIVCQDKTNGDSCGHCSSCKQTKQYVYPDIHWVFPVVKKDGKNRDETTSDDFLIQWRASVSGNPYLNILDWAEAIEAGNSKPNINVAECNAIIRKLSLQSFTDGPKILILWLPEYLGKEGNRLLKLIEEPTDNTFIILVAEDQSRILNTILSRCQLVKVLPYTNEELISFLEQKGHSETRARQVALLAEGNVNKALHIVSGEETNLAEILFDWMRIAYKGDAPEMNQFALNVAGWHKDKLQQFFLYGLNFLGAYHQLLVIGRSNSLSDEELSTANKMKKIIDVPKIELLTNLFNRSLRNLSRNANMKISLMADTVLVGDILKNIHINLPKESNFV